MVTISSMEPSEWQPFKPVGPMRSMREAHKVTGEDVAKALGVSQQRYQVWEVGKVLPSLENSLMLARFYETTVEELFGYLLEDDDD